MRGLPRTLLAYVAHLLQFKSLEKSERQDCPTGQALEWGSGVFSFALESAGFEAGKATLLVPPFTSYRPGSAERFL